MFNERIKTAAAGQTQILFLDESAMTVGPDSDLMIDQFVYDPNTGAGRMAMSATRGILRFVGGKLSKSDNAVTLRTATATIAVRGCVFFADQKPTGQLDVHFVYGLGVSVTGTDGVTQSMHRPGFTITVAGPGSSPSTPYPTPPAALSRLLAALDGRSGGTARPPSNAIIASSGINSVISGNMTASVQAAGKSQPQLSQPVPVNPADVQANFQINTVQSQGTPGIALLDSNNSIVHPAAQFQPLPSPSAPVTLASDNTVQAQGTPVVAPLTSNNPSTSTPTASTTPSTATSSSTPVTTPPPPPPTMVSYADAAFAVVGNSTTSIKNAHAEVATATLLNGVLFAVASTGSVSFPLAPGTNNFGPQGTMGFFGSSSASFSGTSFLASDNAFFYAVGTSASFPNRFGALIGGLPTVTLPTAGIGTYNGSVTGAVLNNGSSYLATGGFSNVYNFATNTGNFTISNFDGNSFSGALAAIGPVSARTTGRIEALGITVPSNIGNLAYGGTLTGSTLNGFVRGGFFGNNAADTGGVFGVGSASGPYKAAGLFGGQR